LDAAALVPIFQTGKDVILLATPLEDIGTEGAMFGKRRHVRGEPKRRRMISESRFALLLLLPTIVIMLLLLLYPFLYSIYLSFVDLNLLKPQRGVTFEGLDNFRQVIVDQEFWLSMRATFIYAAGTVLGSMALGLAAALLLNSRFRLRGLARSLLLVPWALPGVITAMVWQMMLHPNYGAINGLLVQLGIVQEGVAWLSDPSKALGMVMIAQVWTAFPFVALMYLAALQSVPHELVEAAKMDGAAGLSIFRNITLPLLAPITLVLLVLRTIDSFRAFDLIFSMTKGGPANATQLAGLYLYKQGFNFSKFGIAAAGSYVLTAFILIFVLLYMRMLRQRDEG
jgi:ABC-type sugar transport system permease subunit